MKTVGFVISHKENENRRALIPDDVSHVKNKQYLFNFQKLISEEHYMVKDLYIFMTI